MKFLHMADVHLGCVPDGGAQWARQRSREIWDTFQQSVQDAAKMHADLVLIAGDLFHTPPDERMLREVSYLFSSCPGVCFAVIAGNHDYMTKDSAWKRFHFPRNVAVLGEDGCECITFPAIGCEVYGFSYDRPQIEQPLYDGIHPDQNDAFHILLAHGGDALHIPISTQMLEASGFDYIALGHIHRPQMLLKNRAAYSGALSPVRSSDEGPHGYIIGETSGHLVSLRFVPKAGREYVTMNVTVREEDTYYSVRDRIAGAVRNRGTENLYKVILSGRRNPSLHPDEHIADGCGLILSVEDRTGASFHLDELKRRYRGKLIGRYIESFEGEDGQTEVGRRALEYGLEALLTHSQDDRQQKTD